jgi:hypothetical protein
MANSATAAAYALLSAVSHQLVQQVDIVLPRPRCPTAFRRPRPAANRLVSQRVIANNWKCYARS